MNDKPDQRQQLTQELAELQRQLHELTRSLPQHSIKPGHMQRIDELEEAIAERQAALRRLGDA